MGGFSHSSRNLKRVARMPIKDRREILKLLTRQAKERKIRLRSKSSKSKGVVRSQPTKTSSNSSMSSVNKDWEHWVHVQGGSKVVSADVCGIVGLIGVRYKGDTENKCNVLSKEERRGLREEVGQILAKGESEGSGGGC